jgi:hypothetical protein
MTKTSQQQKTIPRTTLTTKQQRSPTQQQSYQEGTQRQVTRKTNPQHSRLKPEATEPDRKPEL